MEAAYLQSGLCLQPKTEEHARCLKMLENDADLKKLQGWRGKISKLDFYGASLAAEAAERLRPLIDGFAQQVFEAHDENR